VDLNPIRADICDTPDTSEFTSVKQRIEELTTPETQDPSSTIQLSSFTGSSLKDEGISFTLTDYLELVDWTGRIVRDDKRGYIKPGTPAVLPKLQLDETTWINTVQGYSKGFKCFIGPEHHLKAVCLKHKRHWVKGIRICRQLFKKPSFKLQST
jgi:hypothetical protein